MKIYREKSIQMMSTGKTTPKHKFLDLSRLIFLFRGEETGKKQDKKNELKLTRKTFRWSDVSDVTVSDVSDVSDVSE